jgi:hypothetical protein
MEGEVTLPGGKGEGPHREGLNGLRLGGKRVKGFHGVWDGGKDSS